MPTRILREGIISSARINALSLGAEVTFRRLMSVADDYGRYYASPATIRGACWPTCPERVTEADVATWLAELTSGENPLVGRYQSDDGTEFLEISNFKQQTRSPSKFPSVFKRLTNDIQMLSTSRLSKADAKTKAAAFISVARETPPNKPYSIEPKTEASKLLIQFPGAESLPGEPDDVILGKCLFLAGNDAESLAAALRRIYLAGKKPATSWAWFPVVLEQYLQPKRQIQRERRA